MHLGQAFKYDAGEILWVCNVKRNRFHCWPSVVQVNYEGGPKNNRNLNVALEIEVVARCAARCRESTPYSSSPPRGVNLG
jgi:hypothetical protein